MAGTNTNSPQKDGDWVKYLPSVILVAPQMGENIGASARAMKNCGLKNLHIVTPRDGWPNPAAEAMAAGGADILENASLHDSLNEATAPYTLIAATTTRKRGMTKQAYDPHAAAGLLAEHAKKGGKTALLFGAERAGLDNEAVAMADFIITAPLNPAFASLNLAGAVLLIGWACRWHLLESEETALEEDESLLLATSEEKDFFFTTLEEHLAQGGFFTSAEMQPVVMRNIKDLFQRRELTAQDLKTLFGMLKAIKRAGQVNNT